MHKVTCSTLDEGSIRCPGLLVLVFCLHDKTPLKKLIELAVGLSLNASSDKVLYREDVQVTFMVATRMEYCVLILIS